MNFYDVKIVGLGYNVKILEVDKLVWVDKEWFLLNEGVGVNFEYFIMFWLFIIFCMLERVDFSLWVCVFKVLIMFFSCRFFENIMSIKFKMWGWYYLIIILLVINFYYGILLWKVVVIKFWML